MFKTETKTGFSFLEIEYSNPTTIVLPLLPGVVTRVRHLFSTQHYVTISTVSFTFITNYYFRSTNVTGHTHINSTELRIKKHDGRTIGYNQGNKVHADVRYTVRATCILLYTTMH